MLRAEEVERAHPALVDRELGLGQPVAMLGVEPLHAERAAGLFIGHGEKYDVAIGRQVEPLEQQHDEQLEHAHALHVERAATPDLAVSDLGRERVNVPELRLRGHHIGVIEQHQRSLRAAADEPGAHRNAARSSLDILGFVALSLEPAGQKLGSDLFVAGRVGGVDAEVFDERADDLRRHFVPVDLWFSGHGVEYRKASSRRSGDTREARAGKRARDTAGPISRTRRGSLSRPR